MSMRQWALKLGGNWKYLTCFSAFCFPVHVPLIWPPLCSWLPDDLLERDPVLPSQNFLAHLLQLDPCSAWLLPAHACCFCQRSGWSGRVCACWAGERRGWCCWQGGRPCSSPPCVPPPPCTPSKHILTSAHFWISSNLSTYIWVGYLGPVLPVVDRVVSRVASQDCDSLWPRVLKTHNGEKSKNQVNIVIIFGPLSWKRTVGKSKTNGTIW